MSDLRSLLGDLLATGDALLTALDAGDIEAAGLLTARRGALVAELPAGGASDAPPEQAAALAAQDAALASALDAARRRVCEALEAQGQRRQAVAAYYDSAPCPVQLHGVSG